MITFLVCLALLVTAYFTYGRYLERLVGIDPAARTPCSRLYDGVDYVPLPRWRIFLIQLLNIAGLGPIFGAVLGAAYGPVAFLWITFGGIFMGAAHDFIAGVISLRHDGASLPETAGVYLGGGMKIVMRLFSAGLMILVGAVFLSQPASLVAARLDVPSLEGIAFGGFSWLLLIVLGVILVYYIAATLLPVDKIIGRIYPVFGFALLFMAVGILVVLLFGGEYTIPEFTSFENCIADAKAFPIVPMLFTTIACGAISGFHATQSPLMARCMRNERESRSAFYGAPSLSACRAAFADFSEAWARYPGAVATWERSMAEVERLFSYGPDVRRVMYTTNAVESVNASFRKVVRRGCFPDEDAVMKLLYLRVKELYSRWGEGCHQPGWARVRNQLLCDEGIRARIERFL